MTSGIGGEFAGRRDRIGTIAVTFSFWTWCVFLSFPLLNATQDYAEFSAEFVYNGASLVWQIPGLALFMIATSLAYPARLLSMLGRLGFSQIAVLAIFLLSLALQLHDEEKFILTGILYTCIFLVAALSVPVLWTMAPADLERCMTGAAVILCCFGITAMAVFGIPSGRDVGRIQANLFAIPLLAGVMFSQFRAGTTGIVVRILCFSMAALVSSRFAVIGSTIAMVLHQFTFEPLRGGKIPLLIVALIASVVFWPQIVEIMALDDPTRGLSSGVSGRDELWHGALATIANNPFGIGFKRTIGNESGHNGYLKTLVEFGVVGGGLILFCVGRELVIAGVEAVRCSGKDRQQYRFACARFGGLAALVFGAFFQPQLFSLGDAFGVSLLFLFFRPRVNSISDRAPASQTIGQPIHLGQDTPLR
jgi:hypothetical protein